MSIVFSIKNKKSLFGYQKVLAAQEVLKLVEGLTTYNYDPATLHRPLNDFEGSDSGALFCDRRRLAVGPSMA